MSGRMQRGWKFAAACTGVVLALLGIGVVTRWADGPIGPLAGGPFSGGSAATRNPEPSRLQDREVVELEIDAAEGRSLLIGVVVRGEEIFLPTTLAPLKLWDGLVERQPRVRLRIDGEIFEGRLRLVEDEGQRRELFSAAQRKYGKGPYYASWAAEMTKFFLWEAESRR